MGYLNQPVAQNKSYRLRSLWLS